ncbi:MAG: leucine-rich repeat domain-containing protein [Treponema sp.]|jgi:hypothetical protein|nr:leucine-rich repeat domain-containing protein [Treponema sp.]
MKMFLRIALMLMAVASVYAQQYDPESDFSVSRSADGKSVTITGYAGTKQVVSIPPQIRQLPVTVIGKEAFYEKSLTSVTIGNRVTEIGSDAFMNNRLTSVTAIRGSAFLDNPLTSITIGRDVQLGYDSFPSGFDAFYNGLNKKAGTYTLKGNSWNEEW